MRRDGAVTQGVTPTPCNVRGRAPREGDAGPRQARTDPRMVPQTLLLSSLEVSDTKVYEPQMRALLGAASHF